MNARTGPDTPVSAVSIENTSDTWLWPLAIRYCGQAVLPSAHRLSCSVCDHVSSCFGSNSPLTIRTLKSPFLNSGKLERANRSSALGGVAAGGLPVVGSGGPPGPPAGTPGNAPSVPEADAMPTLSLQVWPA